MSLPRLALAVIGDEIGPSLDEMISFCAEHEVRRLDMRTVEGRNLLGLSLAEGTAIARRIEQASLVVPTFVSPLLKWPAPGKGTEGGKVDFAFDPADCPADDPLVHAFDMATVFGAEKIRVFSHLRYPGYKPSDLFGRFERLADLGVTYSINVEVENEAVCNIGSVGELAEFFMRDIDSPERGNDALERRQNGAGHRVEETVHVVDELVAQIDDVERDQPAHDRADDDRPVQQAEQAGDDELEETGHRASEARGGAPRLFLAAP